MTDDFRTQFIEAMREFGMAIERESDVPTIDAEDLTEETMDAYTLPMVRNISGTYNYAKVYMSDFVNAVVELTAAQHGLLESITKEEFDTIFY